MSVFSILQFMGAGQGVLLALVLLTSKYGSYIANRYLGALMLLFAVVLIDFELFTQFTLEQKLWLEIFLWPKEYLFGVLLYFYVRELTHPKKYFLRNKQWLHFLPAIVHVAISWSLFLLDSPRQSHILENTAIGTMPDSLLSFLLGPFEEITVLIHISIYLWLSLRLLYQHSIRIKNTFSYSEKVSLNWLRFLVLGMCFIFLIWVVETLLGDWLSLGGAGTYALILSIVILLYLMGYMGLRQPEIFNQVTKASLEEKASESTKEREEIRDQKHQKYEKSALSFDESRSFMDELELLMQKEKLYLDSKISLPDLAQKLNISVNYLSQTINEHKQQNFFDFINNYRIEEAKSHLLHPQKLNENILAIAADSGFNSKSSFYTAFRKHTGVTPGQYRKALDLN